MTIVFVHGFPETSRIWGPLRTVLGRDSLALALPGFGTPGPARATKDAYADWLADALRAIEPPVDLVGHDVGALLSLRLATAIDVELRSFVVDVADIFHPDFVWPERVRRLQVHGVGEEMMEAERRASPGGPTGTAAPLLGHGVPPDLAREIAAAHDEVMSRCILDFYRSAIPNVSAGWWRDVTGPTRARGLVLLLPDPPEVEAMSFEVAERIGADTARLDRLDHCWMAEAPGTVAPVLERFWSSLDRAA
jgi:pimeloyl-ACP methyl ester carboxylesterase